MHCTSSIGQNNYKITWLRGVSGLQYPISAVQSPASVDRTVTSFMDRSSPNLEHSKDGSAPLEKIGPYAYIALYTATACCISIDSRPFIQLTVSLQSSLTGHRYNK